MKTLFEITPFNRPAFSPKLGDWVGDLWSGVKGLLPTASEAWKGYTSAEKAEEERKAAEARAAAAQAQAQTAAIQAQASSGTILGIPTGYAILGGLGLVAIGVIAVVATRK